jgi:hypothetical protein
MVRWRLVVMRANSVYAPESYTCCRLGIIQTNFTFIQSLVSAEAATATFVSILACKIAVIHSKAHIHECIARNNTVLFFMSQGIFKEHF